MERVVVTGGSGFLGKHTIQIFNEKKIVVYAIVREHIPDIELVHPELVHWVKWDLTKDIPDIPADWGKIDCFYHIAWNGVKPSVKNDYEVQKKNMDMAIRCIQLCKEIGCKRFVNLGTVGEYVELNGLINENAPSSPGDVYGAFKVGVRHLLTVLANQMNIEMMHTILSSIYGEYREDENVITYTIKELLNHRKPMYGALDQMWDFLYVKDAAYALYLIGEKGVGGRNYSIGSGVYRHLYEYVEKIRDIIDEMEGKNHEDGKSELGIGELGAKYKKVLNSCVDTFVLQRDTHFAPQYSFENGIKRTINFYKEEMKKNK